MIYQFSYSPFGARTMAQGTFSCACMSERISVAMSETSGYEQKSAAKQRESAESAFASGLGGTDTL